VLQEEPSSQSPQSQSSLSPSTNDISIAAPVSNNSLMLPPATLPLPTKKPTITKRSTSSSQTSITSGLPPYSKQEILRLVPPPVDPTPETTRQWLQDILTVHIERSYPFTENSTEVIGMKNSVGMSIKVLNLLDDIYRRARAGEYSFSPFDHPDPGMVFMIVFSLHGSSPEDSFRNVIRASLVTPVISPSEDKPDHRQISPPVRELYEMYLNLPFDYIDWFLPTTVSVYQKFTNSGSASASASAEIPSPQTSLPYALPQVNGSGPTNTIQGYSSYDSDSLGYPWTFMNPKGTSFSESIAAQFGRISDLYFSRQRLTSLSKANRHNRPGIVSPFIPDITTLAVEDSRLHTKHNSFVCGRSFWKLPAQPNSLQEPEYIESHLRLFIFTDLTNLRYLLRLILGNGPPLLIERLFSSTDSTTKQREPLPILYRSVFDHTNDPAFVPPFGQFSSETGILIRTADFAIILEWIMLQFGEQI
jgi:hypothetical protein